MTKLPFSSIADVAISPEVVSHIDFCHGEYAVKGNPTHIAFTSFGEVALVFPLTRKTGPGKALRLILIGRPGACPAEFVGKFSDADLRAGLDSFVTL